MKLLPHYYLTIGIFSAHILMAQTSIEDLQLAKFAVDMVMDSDEWADNVNEELLSKTNFLFYSSFDEIFSDMTDSQFSSLSVKEKQQSFDRFLYGISQTNLASVGNDYFRTASFALTICSGKSYTNAIAPSKEILKAQNAPCKYYALKLVHELMPPSIEKNEIMYTATTNSVDFDAPLRHLRMYEYVDQLCKLDGTNRAVVTNAASLFYRNRTHIANYLATDRLFKAAYPGYATSSNRSDICEMAYASPVTTPFDRNYFDGVTNELANAPQPLGGVPELDAATE